MATIFDESWYPNIIGRMADPEGVEFWKNYSGTADPYEAFLAAATGHGETVSGWKPGDQKRTGNSGGGLLTGGGTADQWVQTGLSGAGGLISSYTPATYPAYVPSQPNRPFNEQYPGYVPNQPMAQIKTPDYKMTAGAAPQYKGLMGGDYEALQTALTTPGKIAAENAYNTANRDLNNTMGGRGLYGSSIMSTQANEGLNREYMNALSTNAANAAAQRYGLQSANLQNENIFGQTQYGQQLGQEQNINAYGLNAAQLGMTQNQNLWNADLTSAARQQDYSLAGMEYRNMANERQREWENQQGLEKFQYDLAAGQYSNEQMTNMINQYLALAGRGQVTSGQNQAAATNLANMDAASQSSLIGGLLNAGVSAATLYALFGG